jgi:hypothetical protein
LDFASLEVIPSIGDTTNTILGMRMGIMMVMIIREFRNYEYIWGMSKKAARVFI